MERVKAIRENSLGGRGTCTIIDEARTDEELIEMLDEDNIKTPEDAVKWAIANEGLHIENATNFRWGEDDDPQILRQQEWEKQVK